jgi:hypothetical protein
MATRIGQRWPRGVAELFPAPDLLPPRLTRSVRQRETLAMRENQISTTSGKSAGWRFIRPGIFSCTMLLTFG